MPPASRTLDPESRAARRLENRRIDVDRLLLHSRHLPPDELALVRGIYERGMTLVDLARAASLSRQRLRTRLNRALDRLADPAFRYVLERQQRWPPARRDIARLVVLHGRTWRAAAAALGVSLHQVRREIERIRILATRDERDDRDQRDSRDDV